MAAPGCAGEEAGGLESVIAVPGHTRLRRARSRIPGRHGFRRRARRGRPEAMGSGHAKRYCREHPLGHRPGHCRSGADPHRRRESRRLCGTDGTGRRPRQGRRSVGGDLADPASDAHSPARAARLRGEDQRVPLHHGKNSIPRSRMPAARHGRARAARARTGDATHGPLQASGSIANAPIRLPSCAPARNLSEVTSASLMVTSMSR